MIKATFPVLLVAHERYWAPPVAQVAKNPRASAGDLGDVGCVSELGRLPWRRKCSPSRILAWEIPWTEEPGGLQSVGSQRVRHDLVTEHAHTHERCYFWKRKNVCLPELIKPLVFAQESVVCDPWYYHFFWYHSCSSKYSARVMCMTILCLLVFKWIFQHQIQGHLRCKSGLQ